MTARGARRWGVLFGAAAIGGLGLGVALSLVRSSPSLTAGRGGGTAAAQESLPTPADVPPGKWAAADRGAARSPAAPGTGARAAASPLPVPSGAAPPQKWSDLALPDDVLSGRDLRAKDAEAWRVLTEALDPDGDVSQALDGCVDASKRRPGAIPTTQRTEWFLYLTVESKDGIGRIVDAFAPAEAWPRELTPEDRECYRRAFFGFEFKTTHDFRYRYAYPTCLNPASPDVATTDDDGVDMTSFE